MDESTGLSSDWFDEVRSLSVRKTHKLLYISYSKIFHHIRSKEEGLCFSVLICHLFVNESNICFLPSIRKNVIFI